MDSAATTSLLSEANRSLHLQKFIAAAGRLPGAPLLLAAAVLAIAPLDAAARLLQYDRQAMAAGQTWRWITCHFVHWSADHLCWDLLVFVVLGVWVSLDHSKRFLVCVLGSAVAISIGVWLLQPDLFTYRGLSGIDSALFTLAVILTLRQAICHKQGYLVAACCVALGCFLAKSGFEWATGRTLFVNASASFSAVPLAHMIGGLVGIVVALCPRRFSRAQQPKRQVD